MKTKALFIFLNLSLALGQFGYPVEDFFGGGIGYSPMYISLDSIPGASKLKELGLKTEDFDSPFIIHGGEGFAHVTGKWRVGGYAGLGASSISTIPSITVYIEDNVEGFQGGEPTNVYTADYSPTIDAKFSIALGAASVEYVMPVLQDLEISGGALMGLARVNIALEQQGGTPKWETSFENVYGNYVDGILYVPVTDSTGFTDKTLRPDAVPSLLRDVSATFFNFQPYIAMKWQFLERMGLRISVGFNKGTIGNGSWKLNGRTLIGDSPVAAIQGVTFRTMLYIGL